MKQLTTPYQQDKLEYIKKPYRGEFLGLSPKHAQHPGKTSFNCQHLPS